MAHFTALGKTYELATIDSLSFDEARELKRISGFTTAPIIQALAETDPDAWLGLFVVSINRVDGAITAADFANENLIRMVESVESDEPIPTQGAKAPEPEQEPAEPAASTSTSDGDGKAASLRSVPTVSEGEAEAAS